MNGSLFWKMQKHSFFPPTYKNIFPLSSDILVGIFGLKSSIKLYNLFSYFFGIFFWQYLKMGWLSAHLCLFILNFRLSYSFQYRRFMRDQGIIWSILTSFPLFKFFCFGKFWETNYNNDFPREPFSWTLMSVWYFRKF